METLSIIAYFQPITKPEIDETRGFNSPRVILITIKTMNGLKIKEEKEVPGRPVLWQTTKYFLQYFNLSNLKDLPSKKELKEMRLLTKGDNLKDELIN